MKRLLMLLLAALLMAPTAARADVIVEPENAFYEAHRDECTHTAYRCYFSEEEVVIYSAPYGMKRGTVQPGQNFGVEWIYTEPDGSVWGYCEWKSGWIPLGGMQLCYDWISFAEEYADAIVPNADHASFSTWFSEDTVVTYSYPNGPVAYSLDLFDENGAGPELLYTDPDGKEWGFVGYYYGRRNLWICLSNPTDDQLTSEQKRSVPTAYPVPQTKGYVVSSVFWVIGTVLAVVGTAAVLLSVILKRRRK